MYFYWLITKANTAFPYEAASTLPQQNRHLTQKTLGIEKRKLKRKRIAYEQIMECSFNKYIGNHNNQECEEEEDELRTNSKNEDYVKKSDAA